MLGYEKIPRKERSPEKPADESKEERAQRQWTECVAWGSQGAISSVTGKGPCYYMFLHGKCDKPGCTYGHSKQDMADERKRREEKGKGKGKSDKGK